MEKAQQSSDYPFDLAMNAINNWVLSDQDNPHFWYRPTNEWVDENATNVGIMKFIVANEGIYFFPQELKRPNKSASDKEKQEWEEKIRLGLLSGEIPVLINRDGELQEWVFSWQRASCQCPTTTETVLATPSIQPTGFVNPNDVDQWISDNTFDPLNPPEDAQVVTREYRDCHHPWKSWDIKGTYKLRPRVRDLNRQKLPMWSWKNKIRYDEDGDLDMVVGTGFGGDPSEMFKVSAHKYLPTMQGVVYVDVWNPNTSLAINWNPGGRKMHRYLTEDDWDYDLYTHTITASPPDGPDLTPPEDRWFEIELNGSVFTQVPWASTLVAGKRRTTYTDPHSDS